MRTHKKGTKKRAYRQVRKKWDHSISHAIALFSLFIVVQAAPSKSTIKHRMKVPNTLVIRYLWEDCQENSILI